MFYPFRSHGHFLFPFCRVVKRLPRSIPLRFCSSSSSPLAGKRQSLHLRAHSPWLFQKRLVVVLPFGVSNPSPWIRSSFFSAWRGKCFGPHARFSSVLVFHLLTFWWSLSELCSLCSHIRVSMFSRNSEPALRYQRRPVGVVFHPGLSFSHTSSPAHFCTLYRETLRLSSAPDFLLFLFV